MLNHIIPHKKITPSTLFSFEKTPFNLLMMGVTSALLVAFAYGAYQYLLHGHHAYGVSKQHPWGLLIAMYIFFVV